MGIGCTGKGYLLMYTVNDIKNPSHGDIDEALDREYGINLPQSYLYVIGSGMNLYGIIDLLEGHGLGYEPLIGQGDGYGTG